MILTYEISEVSPYINWLYFFHAWQLSGKPDEVKQQLKTEAEEQLRALEGHYRTHVVFEILDANGDGDDLLAGGVRIPMLRQQHATSEGEYNLCLADFVQPLSSGITDKVGVFAATVDSSLEHDFKKDAYQQMLVQTLADRLAEATVERMHEEVRKKWWGYAPDEHLTMEQLHQEAFQGIRPAVGYPSLPDTSVNFILSDILGMKEIGITLTPVFLVLCLPTPRHVILI